MIAKSFVQGFVVAGLLAMLGQPSGVVVATTVSSPDDPATPPATMTFVTPGAGQESQPVWVNTITSQDDAGSPAVQSLQATGGPDDFGYTWNDGVPFSWVDAKTYGTNTGITGSYTWTAPIQLPFSFRFYQNNYNAVYATTHGTLGFGPPPGIYTTYPGQQLKMPFTPWPNNVIAPYWAPLNASTGGVYYLSGGSAPNRWFVVEWYQMRDSDVNSRHTFETVLWENGDIEYRYLSMNYGSSGQSYGFSAGIEDASGTVGLQYRAGAWTMPNNTVVRFTRPAPGPRANLLPKLAGAFGTPGTSVTFNQTIENFGDTGTDTFDLLPSSAWPMAFFADDGVTPLIDSDGSGAVDTGPLAQGGSRAIVVKVAVPGNALQGQWNNGQLLARSKLNSAHIRSMPVRVTVPVSFIQEHTVYSGWPTSGWLPQTMIAQPGGVLQRNVSWGHICGSSNLASYEPVVTALPNGSILHVYTAGVAAGGYCDASQIEATLMDRSGNTTFERTSIPLTNNTAATPYYSATLVTRDHSPSVAVASNGRIAVAWFRQVSNETRGGSMLNVYYMVLDSNLNVVVPVTSLMGDGQWINVYMPDGPDGANRYYRTVIAATRDNRFFIGWQNLISVNSSPTSWYTVRDTNGGVVKPVSAFVPDACAYMPNFEPLADGSVFVSLSRGCTTAQNQHLAGRGNIWAGRLDANGNMVGNLIQLTAGQTDDAPDAEQLPNGNIVIAWHHFNGLLYNMRYTVLNAGLGIVKAVTDVPMLSPEGDAIASITRAGSQAVLTWGEYGWGYRRPSQRLYYALMDAAGNFVVPPMVYLTSNGYNFRLTANGQGSIYLPPITIPHYLPVVRRQW